jgi:hypothetical protein
MFPVAGKNARSPVAAAIHGPGIHSRSYTKDEGLMFKTRDIVVSLVYLPDPASIKPEGTIEQVRGIVGNVIPETDVPQDPADSRCCSGRSSRGSGRGGCAKPGHVIAVIRLVGLGDYVAVVGAYTDNVACPGTGPHISKVLLSDGTRTYRPISLFVYKRPVDSKRGLSRRSRRTARIHKVIAYETP